MTIPLILRFLSVVWLLSAVATPHVFAANGSELSRLVATHGDREPLGVQLVDDARDGRWEEFDLLSAALIAGGVRSPAELEDCRQRFDRTVCRMSADWLNANRVHARDDLGTPSDVRRPSSPGDSHPAPRRSEYRHLLEPSARPTSSVIDGTSTDSDSADQLRKACSDIHRVRALFQFMHREVLTGGYRAEVSQLSRTLKEGSYNCVTATILFQCLCDASGLEATAVATRGHVFSRIEGDPSLDIQTTCPRWLAAVGDAEAKRMIESGNVGALTDWQREITANELVAKVYYNRAVIELDRNQFSAAVRLLLLSLELDSRDSSAQQNLLAALNNWSLQECRQGNYAGAAALLERGVTIDPNYAPIRASELHIHQQWIAALCHENRHAEAVRIVERGYARRPDAELFSHGRFTVYGLWSETFFQAGQFNQAWHVLGVARRRYAGNRDWLRYEAATIASAAGELARKGHSGQAQALLERGLLVQPGNLSLQRSLRHLTNVDL